MPGLDNVLASVGRWIDTNLLIDTVRIGRPGGGEPVYNPDTGQNEYPADSILYEGPGAVQGGTAQSEMSSVPDAGQMWIQETRSRYRLLTPLTAPLASKDDIITVIAVHNPGDTALIGRSWIAQDPARAATLEAVRITPLDQIQADRDTP
ncbi:DUF6093 family protein [Streptomyces antimycoticus]|uniref:DUF6093 family protein n=1 Tax=Streptomyces antimycoticus TaxID=68175 RepID=UPI00367A3C9B